MHIIYSTKGITHQAYEAIGCPWGKFRLELFHLVGLHAVPDEAVGEEDVRAMQTTYRCRHYAAHTEFMKQMYDKYELKSYKRTTSKAE